MYGDLTPRGSGVIDLSSHGLDAVPDDVFTKEDTKVLNLGDNHLASLPSELGTGSCIHLNVVGERGEAGVEDFARLIFQILGDALKGLTILAVNDNLLRKAPKSLAKLQDLKVLDLRHNQLFTLPTPLKKLQNLQKIYLQVPP